MDSQFDPLQTSHLGATQVPAMGSLNAQGVIQQIQASQQRAAQAAQAQKAQQQQSQQALLSAMSSMAQLRTKNKWSPTANVIHPGTGEVLTTGDGSIPDNPQLPDLYPFLG